MGLVVLFLLEIQASFFQAYQIRTWWVFKKKKIFFHLVLKLSEKNVRVVSLYTYFRGFILIKRYYGNGGLNFCVKLIQRVAAKHTTHRKNPAHQLQLKMLSTNQVVVFFAHQYPCSKSIDVLCFLHGNNHQAKVQPETTSFAWVCSARLRDSLIIKISRKDQVICHQGMILSKTSTFGWLWPVLSFCPIRFQDSLIINITRKKIFCIAIVFKKRQHVRLPTLVGCGQVCFLSNHILGIFDYQYLRKESSDILDFLHEDIHQENEVSETTTRD